MQPSGVITTATSAADGRMKVAAGKAAKKGALKKMVKHNGKACTGANCQYC